MTWRQRLSSEQIAATLERHGIPTTTAIQGIRYEDDRVWITAGARRLLVPREVLEMKARPAGPRRMFRGED